LDATADIEEGATKHPVSHHDSDPAGLFDDEGQIRVARRAGEKDRLIEATDLGEANTAATRTGLRCSGCSRAGSGAAVATLAGSCRLFIQPIVLARGRSRFFISAVTGRKQD